MILLCSGQVSPKHFDALVILAQQLEARGHQVAIDDRFMSDELFKQNKYEMAPFLADVDEVTPDAVIMIGAESISADVQMLLRSMGLSPAIPFWALGRFGDFQSEIGTRNKIAYALGYEPDLLNLAMQGRPTLLEDSIAPLVTEIGQVPVQIIGASARIMVFLPGENLETGDGALNALSAASHTPNFNLHILTSARAKDLIAESRQAALSVFSYNELPPEDLLHYFDVLVFLGPNVPGERMATLALNAMGAGKVVVDCTVRFSFASSGAPVLKGPDDPAAMVTYLHEQVIPNRREIGLRSQQSDWLAQFDISSFERSLSLGVKPDAVKALSRKTVFFPTNGNGLGHAQRCALIAEQMQPDQDRAFVAFPSCVDMLQQRGFATVPMVARSGEHGEPFAADLLNFLRLRHVVRAGDQLVFDGGYVFDSVYRLISHLRLRAIWIRRGLWRPEHINSMALERERAFSKVIVPLEAFPELNRAYSHGSQVASVGPIVQQDRLSQADKASLRDRLSVQFDRKIDTLVLTMLGGGVASDRTAQTQFLCSLLERRSNCLHLVVAWPNAVVANGLYGWKNSQVIRTAQALDLCQAADLTVSASGYNSFHELIYAHVPAILIPQAAPYLDDQEYRARAAFERGLAGFIQETQLHKLEREVCAFLDEGKADMLRLALGRQDLPDTGNAAAARLIEENMVT
jgi:UDP-N-acetylglucosamine:LPS N-acetylglucosamine transferase